MQSKKKSLFSVLMLTLFLTFNLISCGSGGGGGGIMAPAGPLQVTTFSTISLPWGIGFDSAGNIYATSRYNYLCSISAAGVESTLIEGNPPFNYPRDIVFDVDDNAYIANDSNHTILKIEPPYNESSLSVYAGATGVDSYVDNADPLVARFNRPYGMARFGDILYIADSGNNQIRKIDLSTGAVSTFVTGGIYAPYDVAVDTVGNVYACSGTSHTIMKYNSAGDETDSYTLDDKPASPEIYSIAITSSGNILAGDVKNHIIWQITPAGEASLYAGIPGSPGSTDGNLLDAQFISPVGIAIGPDGAIYIADSENGAIRKISN